MNILIFVFLGLFSIPTGFTQTPTLGLQDGFLTFDTPSFSVQLVKDSQTLYSLKPKGNSSNFDFIPFDVMSERQYDGNYHLGDVTFRARVVDSSTWVSGDTATQRRTVMPLSVSGNTLAAAQSLPRCRRPPSSTLLADGFWITTSSSCSSMFRMLRRRRWKLALLALLWNSIMHVLPACLFSIYSSLYIQIFTNRTAAETNEQCSLFDPYIGQDAGYVQVTPLLGTLPPLLVLPVGKSPLEGWRFLPENTSAAPFYQSQTFEGLYEWQFHTLAYAQNEWANVTPWNAPSSAILQPGETRTYGLRFLLAPSIRGIEGSLQGVGRPVAIGIPGYIVPSDQIAKLFLNYASTVQSMTTSAWKGYTIAPHTWGRSRLTITYADRTTQTVHYYVTNAAAQTISDLGNFLTTSQWFNDPTDPFQRSPSVISYDREVNAVVRNDPRAWIPGLSDEAGAGSWLAAAVKQFAQPHAAEVQKMEQYINQTLWGSVQNFNGSVKKVTRPSLSICRIMLTLLREVGFLFQPSLVPNYSYPSTIDWSNWWSWNQADSFATDRAYDYVHVIAAYWALYRVARNYPSLTSVHSWEWYINQAVLTVTSMTDGQVGYTNDGLMEETVIRYLLDDLKREGLSTNATLVESRMKARETVWAGERYPFGSEMAWDSTGQEGVYAWATYFNDTTTATNVINSILAYQPTVPHWGYNGNARRYWDNVGLNAIPLISQFRSTPTDYYLLRVGFAGLSGPLSNIDQGGFASASFHSFADTLKWDAYSGDYGPNFVGHALEMGTYIVDHPDFGWQAFGGIVIATSPTVQVQCRDSLRRRVFLAPLGAWLSLDAGAFSTISLDPFKKAVTITITRAVEGVAGLRKLQLAVWWLHRPLEASPRSSP
ncbi:hypothetical protein A0H81_01702 [Grifola frondosa]|uniref:Uncharacterized protein n=1 Tax=Grifola frondosa TaxID=5627 RepID=A0A1C7MLG3_GRIFR|nr:hypothetical protein A0H81_01702 [Grifola frondosa]